MITASIIIGIIALVAAHQSGLTQTWLGTGSVTALVLFMCILALPDARWMFDSMTGFGCALTLWAGATTFYHRLLSGQRRQTPVNVGRRAVAWQFGRFVVAVGVTA